MSTLYPAGTESQLASRRALECLQIWSLAPNSASTSTDGSLLLATVSTTEVFSMSMSTLYPASTKSQLASSGALECLHIWSVALLGGSTSTDLKLGVQGYHKAFIKVQPVT